MTAIETAPSLEERVEEAKGLAYFVANRFKKRAEILGIDYEDLVSESMIGLIKAIRKFDSSYGVKFSTYAVPKIEGELRRFFRDTNPGPKFSRRMKELSTKISGTETVEEIIEKFGLKKEFAVELLAFKNKTSTLSMDKALTDTGEEDLTIGNFVGYKEDFSVVYVSEFLSTLPPKLREIAELTLKEKTQKEIAKVLGCSQVHVSRQLKKIPELYQAFYQM